MVLPQLVIKKKKKNPYRKFVNLACTGIGLVIIIYAGIDFLRMVISF
jgi:hypothetical protein